MGASYMTVAESWPLSARSQARQLVEEYGLPHMEAPDRLEWQRVECWRRVCARRDGFLEETVPYQVPEESVGNVNAFGGRLFVDRFHKEVTAIGESEEMNRLTLNLMHDMIIGAKTRGQAWEKYQRSQQALVWHYPDPYVRELQFHTDTYQLEPGTTFRSPRRQGVGREMAYVEPREQQPYSR